MPLTVDPRDLSLLHRFVLATVGACGADPIPAKLWLEKEVFLVSKRNERLAREAEFIPYLKGPWSEALDISVEELRNLGLVRFDAYGRHITLTAGGREIFTNLKPPVPVAIQEAIAEAKQLLNDLSEDELLLFVYLTYPDMTTGSVVADRITPSRVKLARSLYVKEKVSLEKAAELAGVALSKFRALAGGAEA